VSNAIFPSLPGLMFPVAKTANWSTKVQDSTSGKETRLSFWSYPRWNYDLPFEFLRSDATAELQTLLGFFNDRKGSYDDWLFNDPDDNVATGQLFGVGDGVTTSFQLARAIGGVSEPVRAVNTITQVTKTGVVTTDYTINMFTGLLTFTTAPTAGQILAWTGTFYWRCRFMDDAISPSKFMQNLWELRSLQFQSIK
jgi:uncharacterized protein (TIGR02217 family)